jgi:hypothetical protein
MTEVLRRVRLSFIISPTSPSKPKHRAPVQLGRVVSKAREACKLPFLVGAAPVVYGLPVELA